MIRRPPRSTRFPCTPLFRSVLLLAVLVVVTGGFTVRGLPLNRPEDLLVVLATVVARATRGPSGRVRSVDDTPGLQSQANLACLLLLPQTNVARDRSAARAER